MGNHDFQTSQDLEQVVRQLQAELEAEQTKNRTRETETNKTLSETEELAKNLQETTMALAQERQFALARAEKERLISSLVERINRSFDLDEILSASVEELGHFLKVDRCGVLLFEGGRNIIANEYCNVMWQREFNAEKVKYNSYVAKALSKKENLLVDNLDSNISDDFTQNAQSFFAVPLSIGDNLSGMIYLQQCNKPRRWTKKEQDLLETTSFPLAAAIEKIRLYTKTKARTAQEELLNRLTARIRSSLNLDEILSRTVKELGVALNVARCFVFTDGYITDEYCRPGVRSLVHEDSRPNFLLLDKLAASSDSADTIVINKLITDENLARFTNEEKDELLRSGAKSAIAIPLHSQDVIHSWLVFHSEDERMWGFDDVNFIESVASQVVVAITQSKIYEKLNSYQEKLSRELKQAARVQTALIGGDVFDANLETSVFYKAHSNVSGDLYWVAELSPHTVGVLIGDVSGKGPAAALLTGYILGQFNSIVANSSMAWYPDKMINFLCKSVLYQNTYSDFYATAWYGVFDLRTGEVKYCNAGHLNPYVIQSERVYELDESKDSGIPLGLLDPKEMNEQYECRHLHLYPGNKMVLFTDGVIDQQMPNGEFVPKDWIEKELAKRKDLPVKDITLALNDKLNEMSSNVPLSDDRLMICLEQSRFNISEFNAEDPQECEALVKKIVQECIEYGMPDEQGIDLKLGLIEALTNAVRYGLNKNPYGQIELGYSIAEGSFKMSIIDPGPGFNWQVYNNIGIDEVGIEDEGGRGIPLLREVFDKVTWNPSGNQIGLFFYW